MYVIGYILAAVFTNENKYMCTSDRSDSNSTEDTDKLFYGPCGQVIKLSIVIM